MTSVEIPYSIAAALPTLTVLDITNEVARDVGASGHADGIAFVSPTHETSIVRLSEREDGIFTDVEDLLTGLIAPDTKDRERLLLMLLGARTEQLPFQDGAMCLGTYQRVLLFGLGGADALDWRLTIIA